MPRYAAGQLAAARFSLLPLVENLAVAIPSLSTRRSLGRNGALRRRVPSSPQIWSATTVIGFDDQRAG
ncbi:hypothetical protein AZH51_02875 [Branchiibius sp. NY16-3462-2]|nr:hypothetical protein AZH51_02875 [Branchiibius sp. NY16-3462-2]